MGRGNAEEDRAGVGLGRVAMCRADPSHFLCFPPRSSALYAVNLFISNTRPAGATLRARAAARHGFRVRKHCAMGRVVATVVRTPRARVRVGWTWVRIFRNRVRNFWT